MRLCMPILFFGAGDFGGVREIFNDCRVEFAKLWQQFMPHFVSRVNSLLVSGVIAPSLVSSPEKVFDLASANVQQRTNERTTVFRKLRIDSCQATGTCAAEKSHEDSFGLVVLRMRKSNLVRLPRGQQSSEKAVTQLTRSGLQAFFVLLCARWSIA